MTAAGNDGSVVIAGLGLRLGPLPVDGRTSQEESGLVFVTELLPGGAAERSNLLRVNDEILHVDHTETVGRTVKDVKNSILGVPGTSVRIGIRRNGETFELSFVRGHSNSAGTGSSPTGPSPTANMQGATVPSTLVKGTPSSSHAATIPARPTPKALFRSPGSDKDMQRSPQVSLIEAAKNGDIEQIAMLAADLMNMASKGDLTAVRELLDYDRPEPDLALSSRTCHITIPSPAAGRAGAACAGLGVCEAPTLLYDGASPSPPPCADRERAAQLAAMIESLMDATGAAAPPPPVDRSLLRDLIMDVAAAAGRVQSSEPRLLELPAPCYVLGDLHGNLADLHFFRRTLWPAGVAAQAGDLLFLGDFVDRGADSVPVVAYMMAMKVLHPRRWWMIRGNHETREVNGNIKTYREGSFLSQCNRIFGEDDGRALWERVNDFFDTLPLAARVARRVFCVHGGVPRELCQPRARLEDINAVPCPLRVVRRGDMVHAMLWSDPIPPEREEDASSPGAGGGAGGGGSPVLDQQGFGLSSRGCSCFGERTLDIFLEMHRMKFVFRGHEAQQHGIGLSKSARLCTIFSTSKDHFTNDTKTTCGCVLVAHGTILPIVRSSPSSPRPALETRIAATPRSHAVPAGKGITPMGKVDGNVPRPVSARKGGEVLDSRDNRLFVC